MSAFRRPRASVPSPLATKGQRIFPPPLAGEGRVGSDPTGLVRGKRPGEVRHRSREQEPQMDADEENRWMSVCVSLWFQPSVASSPRRRDATIHCRGVAASLREMIVSCFGVTADCRRGRRLSSDACMRADASLRSARHRKRVVTVFVAMTTRLHGGTFVPRIVSAQATTNHQLPTHLYCGGALAALKPLRYKSPRVLPCPCPRG